MTFFKFKARLWPLVAVAASLFVIVFGLVAAREENMSYYLLGVLVWVCLFGCLKGCLKMIPAFVVFGGAFAGIAYASAGGDVGAAVSMLNRFGALFRKRVCRERLRWACSSQCPSCQCSRER